MNNTNCGPEEESPKGKSKIEENSQNTRCLVIQQELDVLVAQLEEDLANLERKTQEDYAMNVKSTSVRGTPELCRLDVLEIYCEPESRLTKVCQQLGLKARRFTRADGDLSTSEGRDALWRIIQAENPRNIWVAPECGPWGNFSRLNMSRSSTTRQKILNERNAQHTHTPQAM